MTRVHQSISNAPRHALDTPHALSTIPWHQSVLPEVPFPRAGSTNYPKQSKSVKPLTNRIIGSNKVLSLVYFEC